MKTLLLLASISLIVLAQGEVQDDLSKKDLVQLQGDWNAVVMIQDGNKMPPDDAGAYFRSVKGDKYTMFRYEKTLAKWTFTLDATKNPKTIDARRDGDEKGTPVLGIYEFEGEKFKLCVGALGKARPTAFESKPGSGQVYSVWERERKK